jgi:hypothetical protein
VVDIRAEGPDESLKIGSYRHVCCSIGIIHETLDHVRLDPNQFEDVVDTTLEQGLFERCIIALAQYIIEYMVEDDFSFCPSNKHDQRSRRP